MTVEFISAINVNPGNELNRRCAAARIDPEYLTRYARALEDAGFDYTLVPYGSRGPTRSSSRRRSPRHRAASSRSSRCGPTPIYPDRRGQAARDPRPALGRPRGRAHHRRRQRRRAGPRRATACPRTSATTGRRSASSILRGSGPKRTPFEPRGHVLPVRGLRSRRSSPSRHRSRSRSADRPTTPTASAARSATSSASGASRSPTPREQIDRVSESARARRPHRHARGSG